MQQDDSKELQQRIDALEAQLKEKDDEINKLKQQIGSANKDDDNVKEENDANDNQD